jgi:beta-aspartyl-dipeptidase (metallo-type)
MFLIANADIYAPGHLGRADILVAGGRIERVGRGIRIDAAYGERVEAADLLVMPGFIDAHVHITGGGGEGGYATRTPELQLSDAIRGGVTTVVGCLGTDGITRSPAALLAKARALDEEGITALVWTGHYAVPVQTLTGSIERDLLLIDKVIGAGEIAVSDHRSTQPTFDEFARVAAEARRGGILSGKAGIVNVHLGDGRRGLSLLRRIVEETEIPSRSSCRRTSTATPTCSRKGSRGRRRAAAWTSPPPPSRPSSPRAK